MRLPLLLTLSFAVHLASPLHSAETPNLLKNGDFSQDLADWEGQVGEDANAEFKMVTYDNVGHAAEINVITPGRPVSVQFYQRSIPLEDNTDYEVSFWAKASEKCEFAANGTQGVPPFKVYSQTGFELGPKWKQYQFAFSVDQGLKDGRITFTNMGGSVRTYWVANVQLVKKGPSNTNPEALIIRVRSQLANFTNWLKENNVQGFIGETGWPGNWKGDSKEWNRVADLWMQDADAANLWVTYWATGIRWGNTYFAQAYTQSKGAPGVDTPNPQAEILEKHLSTPNYERGICVAGAEFSSANAANPGIHGTHYAYDHLPTYRYLASRGLTIVRIGFRWERLQRKIMGELDPGELERLKKTVADARQAGLKVILDPHNYASYAPDDKTTYKVGTKELPYEAFADFWIRISNVFKDDPGVFYGLMNEPVDIPAQGDLKPAQVWEEASQAAVDAIRNNGDNKTILVPGYFWSSAARWPEFHPKAWIKDPANNFRYEAHHYFDSDNSGTYKHTYAQDLADSQRRGYGAAAKPE